MTRLWIAVATLYFTQWVGAWHRESVSPKSWSGVIINSGCTVDEAGAEPGTAAAVYPPSQVLFMPAISERVPVFEGTFRIRRDVKISTAAEFSSSLGAQGNELTIAGTIRYQACDSKACFLPATAQVQWQLKVLPLDRQRAPEAIRHK